MGDNQPPHSPGILTFTGPFKELKHHGFHHVYLFANRYRCWSSYEIGNGRDTKVWASQRAVEVLDMGRLTYLLMQFIHGDKNHFFLNLEDQTIEVWDWDKHPEMRGPRCREYLIQPETVEELKLLDDKGWLKISKEGHNEQ